MAEAYVMVSLVQCGYADQNEVALAFGCSARTLRRHQRRYEAGGMSTLGKSPWRPQETQAEPSPWVRTAAAMQRNGMSIRDIAHRIKVSKTTVNKWLNRFGKWVVESRGALPQPQKDRVSNPSVDSATPISANSNVRGWSLDADPRNRVFDRLFARLGMLEDATPLFSPGKRIPRAGVLLAVPVLVESGILSVAEEVYGQIGPAFYGLRTTILALSLMALLRIKQPESIKEHLPADVGRVLGLDRSPEVKTLRRKLSRLAAFGKAEIFGQ